MTEPSAANDMPQPGGVPLDRPYYAVPVGEAIRRYVRKYATFTGRASRSEYWWWWLTSFAVTLVFELIGDLTGSAPLGESTLGATLIIIWGLVTVVGDLALGARRLHDANLSGWWQLLHLVPFLGSVVIFIMTLLPPNARGTRFDV